MDKTVLEKVLSRDNWWIGISTLAVVIGIAGEYVAHFVFDRDTKRHRVETIVTIAFGVLVLGGVFGEFVFGAKISEVSEQIQRNADTEVAQLNARAASAEAQVASANARIVEADEQAEKERLARIEIEAKVAWRRLTERQKEDIGSNLRRFSNQAVSFWYNGGDSEASMFAADIAEALQRAHSLRVFQPAGLMVIQESGHLGGPIKHMATGVVVQSTQDNLSNSLADAIIKELVNRGFDAKRQTDPPFDKNPAPQVWVNVEPRPDGPQGELKLQQGSNPATSAKSKERDSIWISK